MIVLKDLTKIYGHVKAVDNVNLEVPDGDFTFIAGRSGSGKTTLLSMIAGLTKPTFGAVLINGADIWSLNDKELSALRNRRIGFMFQGGYVIPTLTVIDNVALPAVFKKVNFDVYDKSRKMLEKVGLLNYADRMPSKLSGGERRRISIARALMNDPEIILADEPTAELDVETETETMRLLEEIHHTGGVTMLMVSHNYDLASYATRRYRMSLGRLTEAETLPERAETYQA
ncbi:MAG TPA: ABC transporter ATP-binding protein [Methylomirabilota bacterium]|nr:ABC transporter ATP-binding protein [Methylomirabilota bacterium]